MNQEICIDGIRSEDYLENTEQKYLAQINAQRKEIENLQNTILKQNKILGNLFFAIENNRKQLSLMENELSCFQNTKMYKKVLLMRRIKHQFLFGSGEDRKDFLKWFWQHIAKKLPIRKPKTYARALLHFDMLHNIRLNMMMLMDHMEQSLSMQVGYNTKGIRCKEGRRFFIFAGIPYYDIGGGQRYAQIAKTLNSMGYSVYYIYCFDSAEEKRISMYNPCIKHLPLSAYSIEEFALDLQEDDTVIFEIPISQVKPYLDYANAHGIPTVYEHVDNWDSSLGAEFFTPEYFREFLHSVQHITVTARLLGEKIEEAGREDYHYCPNAVDSSLFEPNKDYIRPSDLVTGKRTLLYYGSLWGEWFDWDLVAYVARNCNCEINLIGDFSSIAERQREMPSNVHFLGLKQQTELPAYLHYSDMAILPFKNSVIGKYVSPLKVFEYIAMNKPVLATALDDIKSYPNVIASDDKVVWKHTVESIPAVQDTVVFTAENSWYARCNQLLDIVGRVEESHPSVSVIVLNRNNKNVIFRCVDSLLVFSEHYDMEIIVVDNDSTDGSCELLMQAYSDRIKVIRHGKNGCSSGRNLGVRYATGELLLFLDSDQWVVGAHYLDAAMSILSENENIGAVGWAAGWFDKGTVVGPIAEHLPNRGIKGPWVMFRTDVAYLGSGGMLMKRELFEKIGGFDESYDPTCFEDTDISLKIRDAGYELAYCPYMAIMHLPHQTTNSGSKGHLIQITKNSELFLTKWQKQNPKLLEYHL